MLPPLRETTKASDNADFGAHSRSFRTCSPTLRVSCCHSRARLASGWLAGLYREGVEPPGLLRKVSELLHLFPLSWIYPDATLALLGRLLLVRVDSLVMQASEKPQQIQKWPPTVYAPPTARKLKEFG